MDKEEVFKALTRMDLTSSIQEILKAGIQAPSGDNCQPWAFKVKDNYIDLFLRPGADLSFFNYRQFASVISCGAVLENMQIKASELGFNVDYKIDTTGDFSKPIAQICLDKTKRTNGELASLAHVIFTRCTNRKAYKKQPIPSEQLNALQQETAKIPGCELILFKDRKDILKLAYLVYLADRLRTERRDLHEHLMSMIRWSEDEMLKRRDGLPLKNLEAGLAGEIFLKMTRPWKVMKLCNAIGLSRLVAFHSFKLMISSSAVGIITIPQLTLKDVFLGGRAIERVWLQINKIGLCMQPMTAITLFLMRWATQKEDFLNTHQKILEKINVAFEGLCPNLEKENFLFLFRVGYADNIIKYPTLRYNLDHFLC